VTDDFLSQNNKLRNGDARMAHCSIRFIARRSILFGNAAKETM